MSKIVRTPTQSEGGITPEEKERMGEIAQKWIDIAMRTEPIEPNKIIPAVHALYDAAGLKRPRVVIVPSPLVMSFSYGAAAWIWHCRKNGKAATRDATYDATRDATDAATRAATASATYDATLDATDAATRAATDAATRAATLDATLDATYDATRDATASATRAATDAATRAATDAATRAATDAATLDGKVSGLSPEEQAAKACRELAGQGGILCSARWWPNYQGGNMWAAWGSFLQAARDVLGLQLPEHAKYQAWEDCAMHGGFRVLHEEFCIVSDFPAEIHKDEQNRPHNEHGPSHRWRDGWSLYHWHGVKVPKEWITEKRITAAEALNCPNVEQRRAACEILGWSTVLESSELNPKIIDEDEPHIGTLIQVDLPDAPEQWFLKYQCGTGRWFAESVNDKSFNTALKANAGGNGWRGVGDPLDFIPFART